MRTYLLSCWVCPMMLGVTLLGLTAQDASANEPATGNAPPSLPRAASLERGHPFVRNYTPREYQAYATTHALAQDDDGVMYVGTRGCLLEFDGVTWHRIAVGQPTSSVRGLAVQPGTGTVFVGSSNELGYLRTSLGGEHTFVSLLDQLPPELRAFRETTAVYALGDAVYFVVERHLLRWQHGHFKTWSFAGEHVIRSACVDGSVYIQNTGDGLLRVDGDTLATVSTDPVVTQWAMMFLRGNPDGSLLFGTFSHGLYTIHNGVAEPSASPASELLKNAHVRAARCLHDGRLVVGTMSSGVLVFSPTLEFTDRWDAAAGLQNEEAWEVFEDREGGVWLSLDSGVSRVEPSFDLSIFDEGNGFKNQLAWDIKRIREHLYLATSAGVFRFRLADPTKATDARLEPLLSMAVCESICPADEGMLVCGPGVVWLQEDGRAIQVRDVKSTTNVVLRSQVQRDRWFTGTNYNGLSFLRQGANEAWAEDGSVPSINDEVRSLVEEADGKLWVGGWSKGLFQVRFAEGQDGIFSVASVISHFDLPGPLHGQGQVTVKKDQRGELLAGAPNGIFRYDPSSDGFLPADFAPLPTGPAGPALLDGFVPSDDGQGVWMIGHSIGSSVSTQYLGWSPRQGSGSGAFQPLPAKIGDRLGQVTDIFPDRNGILWIAGTEGLIRLDGKRWLQTPRHAPIRTLLRRAFTTDGQNREDQPQPISVDALPAARNTVHFDYAATTFEASSPPSYQVRLAGLGTGQWSSFYKRTSADYTNLPEGNYTFEVRAQTADGQLGSVTSQSFRVLPPWQRSPAAYTLYALALILAGAGLVRWRGRQLLHRNTALEAIVSERTIELRGREAELVHARDLAESANRAKSAFLANMTHELRTPLNAILGYSQVLMRDSELSARNRERVATMDRSGHHLLSMINEVLDLSKIEAGKLTLLPTSFSLDALLDDLCAAFAPRFSEKGINFGCSRVDGLPTVIHTDAGKLRQVLFNLLGNALKFTSQGRVRLEVALAAANRIRFEVADTGSGIAPGELGHIFLAFHQAGDQNSAAQGTGLGLAISRRLVELLGGHLEVESTPGQGSRFWFDLALPPVAETGTMLSGEPAFSGQSLIVGYQGARRRLLVVDDEAVNRAVLRELLAPLGFEVAEAADGAECLRRCVEAPPDALLLDLRMRPLHGLEVARRLRAQGGQLTTIRIVAVSASVFADDRRQAIEAGCDDFLPKPFREEQLLAVLGRLLGLEWVHAAAVSTTKPATAIDPSRFDAEIVSLVELAHDGDILALRTRFAALRDGGQVPDEHQALLRQLEPLLAGYEVDRAHALLRQYQTHDVHA